MSVKQLLVLDGEKGELVKTSGRLGKGNEVSDAKTLAALKSHSEAERRRRERINAHFATLRSLVPSSEKVRNFLTDKSVTFLFDIHALSCLPTKER